MDFWLHELAFHTQSGEERVFGCKCVFLMFFPRLNLIYVLMCLGEFFLLLFFFVALYLPQHFVLDFIIFFSSVLNLLCRCFCTIINSFNICSGQMVIYSSTGAKRLLQIIDLGLI